MNIKITDRKSLTEATQKANLDAPPGTGSWISKPDKRAEIVSEPAWQEIERLRTILQNVLAMNTRSAAALRKYINTVLEIE